MSGDAHPSDAPRAERPRPGALSALLEELVATSGAASGSAWESALRPGAVVGRFELVRELGRGGFGVVYEARDTVLGRSVAFKAVKAGRRTAASEERLLREAEAAARLAHPNIVTLHDVGRTEHGPYLVLELLRGRTLAQRLEQGPLTVREALRIGVEVAKGLAYAHGQGVIHRDLTPGNVFLCDDGQVKILDLGMAHAFGRRKLDGGTPAYMAPEQWRGAPEDERTDVFALGVVLHRMLSGELPFERDADGRAGPEQGTPTLDVPDLPALGPLVARMLSPDPVARPRDAGEVLDALAAYQQELARAPASGSVPRVRARPRSRRRVAALVVAAVLVLGALATLVARRQAAPAPAVPSVAVLPFSDLSPEKDQQYFSEGLSDEIQNALAHVAGLRVTGRSSSLAFRNRTADLRAIGRKLNVGAVLEGSVRKAGNRVRVTAQLVDLRNGYDLWSETFDRELADVFAVQDEIARAVVAALQVKLLGAHAPTTKEYRTTNSAVYTQYLLGRQFYSRFTTEDERRAVDAFEKTLALDPSYAPAWSALAVELQNVATSHKPQGEASAILRRSFEAAQKAIALDPELAEGWAARGLSKVYLQWDFLGAEDDMRRALALAPGDADTQRRYGVLLGMLGRTDDAIAATRRAIDLDPLVPANWSNLAGLYASKRELALARSAIDRALEISPGMTDAIQITPFLLMLEGKPEAAIAAVQRAPSDRARLMCSAMAEHALGHARESQQALDDLIARYGDTDAIGVAVVYAWRGQLDRSFEWFDRAYARHDMGLVHLHEIQAVSPALPRDPRFRELLRKVGLPGS
jgi:eukaryotic-like serine/threonine-protein kinase